MSPVLTLLILIVLSASVHIQWMGASLADKRIQAGGDKERLSLLKERWARMSKLSLLGLLITTAALVITGRISGSPPSVLISLIPIIASINLVLLIALLPGYVIAIRAIKKKQVQTKQSSCQ